MRIDIFFIVLVILAILFSGCAAKTPEETPGKPELPEETGTEKPTPFPTFITPTIPVQTPAPAVELQATYIVWIDSDYGFYRVRAVRGYFPLYLPPDLDLLNISINTGDKVRWMNDDSYDFPLTLVSNEGLWTGRTAYMRWQGARFEYVFNKTGTYTFSVKEFSRIRNQTINVVP